MATQRCRGVPSLGIAPHDEAVDRFSAGKAQCKACNAAYFADWKARQSRPRAQAAAASPLAQTVVEAITPQTVEYVPEPITSNAHTYRPDPRLVALDAAAFAAQAKGHALTVALHGPRGSGKTDGVRYLAVQHGLPFIKIDAKSMLDVESWFGRQGAVNGSTYYVPSKFVTWAQQACYMLIDEYNRTPNDVRDVLNPILDGTRRVTNPVTGEVLILHPDCHVMLAGNVGFEYTGTYEVDPALSSRVLTLNMEYPKPDDELLILRESTGIEEAVATRLVRLGSESRTNPKQYSVSTRELMAAAALVAEGLSETTAVQHAVIEGLSSEGGSMSPRELLKTLWDGIAAAAQPVRPEDDPLLGEHP